MPSSFPRGCRCSLTYVLEPPHVEPRELARRTWDAIVVGGGHNGLTAAAYLARAGRSVARPRAAGAARRRVHARAAVLRSARDREPVRVRRRAARRDRRRRAGPRAARLPRDARRPQPLVAAARRAHGGAVPRPGADRGSTCSAQGFSRARRRRRRRLRGRSSTGCARRCVLRDAWSGPVAVPRRARRARGRRSASDRVLFEDSSPTCSSGTSRTRTCAARCAVRASSARWPGRAIPGRRRSTSCTPWGPSKASAARGATSRAGWDACRRRWPPRRRRRAPCSRSDARGRVEILPGEGVVLESGERIAARAVRVQRGPEAHCCGSSRCARRVRRSRVAAWRTESPVVKVNALLSALPTWTAAAEGERPERAMMSVSAGVDGMQAAVDACRAGVAAVGFCELYVHTAYDASVAPPGKHLLSVFAQYAPYGTDRAARASSCSTRSPRTPRRCATASRSSRCSRRTTSRSASASPAGTSSRASACPIRCGTGAWRREPASTALYLCGAATHPGGSVIALNGRNAARVVLEDLG